MEKIFTFLLIVILCLSVVILIKVDKKSSSSNMIKSRQKLRVRDYPISICQNVPELTNDDCARWKNSNPTDMCTDSGGNSTDCASAVACCNAVCCPNCDASNICSQKQRR